ncbi:Uncharacterized protein QTN25_006055 [Entamoeba marina]
MLTLANRDLFVPARIMSNLLSHKSLIVCALVLMIFASKGDTHFCIFQNDEQEWVSLVSQTPSPLGFEFRQFTITSFSKSDLIQTPEQKHVLKQVGDKLTDDSMILCLQNCGALAVWFIALFIMIF